MNSSLLQNVETGLPVKNSVHRENLNNMHLQETNMLTSAYGTDLHNSSIDDNEQSFPDIESVPSAVLQTNGEFMCSCCEVMMKSARAIKRHLSTHMSLHSFQPPTSLSCETADSGDYYDDNETWKRTKNNGMPASDISSHTSKRLQKPQSNKNNGAKWRSYPCKDCDTVCTSSALLQIHRVQMHRPHECQKCGMALAGRRNFSQHVRSEHPGQHICKVPVFTCAC